MKIPLSLPPAAPGLPDVVILGENSLDFVAAHEESIGSGGKYRLSSFDTLPGGQGATAAVGCARQGLRVRYVGVLGSDDWGRTITNTLEHEGVEVSCRYIAGARSRVAVILVDARGERTVLEFRDPALARAGSPPAGDPVAGRVLLVDATDVETSISAAASARAAGTPTVVDVDRVEPTTARLLTHIDILIAPAPFVVAFAAVDGLGTALRRLAAEFRPAVTIATMGEAGTLALVGGDEFRTAAFDVPVIDTTGAGDALRAGFISGWHLLGPDPEVADVLTWANATAALNCRAVGAQTALPTREEVTSLVTMGRPRRSK